MICCRSASALEEAARTHKERTGRPFVLIIDAVDRLAEQAPDILETLQERHCSLCPVLRIMVHFYACAYKLFHLMVGHKTKAVPNITKIRLQQCCVQVGTAVLSCSSCCIAEEPSVARANACCL